MAAPRRVTNPPRVFLVGAAVGISPQGVFFFLGGETKETVGRNETRHICDWSATKTEKLLEICFLGIGREKVDDICDLDCLKL